MLLYLIGAEGVYSPEDIEKMATAFDRVCQSRPQSVSDNDEVREQCGRKIIRLVDQGQQDPERLFELTLREVTDASCAVFPVSKNPRALA